MSARDPREEILLNTLYIPGTISITAVKNKAVIQQMISVSVAGPFTPVPADRDD